MTKSNGIKSLKQAAKLLNKHSPDGESLAYINPEEARLLRARGGSGIQTLSTVPSYAKFLGIQVPFTGTDDWGTVGGKVWNYITGRYQDEDAVYSEGKVIQPRQSGVGNLFQDAISIYAFLRAKKDAEGLNDAEMSEFNRLNAQLTASQEQFTEYTGGGEQLKAPEYVTTPKAVTRDIDFSGETTPELITTPRAHGGRIGAFNGGIQGLMPQQAMPQQGLDPRMSYNLGGIDRPFQGVGALNRMGYQMGSPHGVEMPTFSEGVNQEFPSNELGAIDTTVQEDVSTTGGSLQKLVQEIMGLYEDIDIQDAIGLARQILEAHPERFAHGGRIGAQGGGIMPLLDMGGMEKDYRQEGGFVPIGRREKADDVPARLSKNEFVFTADAVKAAGGGDIDEGAQRMYNVMKNLEAGGQISQQSQGKA